MSVRFPCPECQTAIRARDHLAGLQVRCPACSVQIAVPRPVRRPAALCPEVKKAVPAAQVKPWLPGQVFAISFLCGPLAGGVATGVNFSHMGKRSAVVPWALAGAALFAVGLGVALVVPASLARGVGLLFSLGAGLVFLLAQRNTFAGWKTANWAPTPGEKYNPGRLGQLLLIGLGCLAVELAFVALVALLG
jgi:predicted Zn finger-like uncharacterized protein